MKFILSMVLVLSLGFSVASGTVFAGCGKKVTNKGTLKSVDSDTKVIVVASKGEETKLTLTPGTKAKGAKLADMVGKYVTIISEHKKVGSITLAQK